MSGNQGFEYAADIVLCIDATGSMGPVIEEVKRRALQFPDDLVNAMAVEDRVVNELRLRVIIYRDIFVDTNPIVASPFFKLPDDRVGFDSFVGGITADGGGDEPESGLEAVAVALNSDWTKAGNKRRHLVVVWTDASAHPLEKGVGTVPAAFQSMVPANFDELSDMWSGGQKTSIEQSARRIVLFAPETAPWSEIQEHWEEAVKKQHQENQANIIAGLRREFGDNRFEHKLKNFKDFGYAPMSIVSYHNLFFHQVHRAFVIEFVGIRGYVPGFGKIVQGAAFTCTRVQKLATAFAGSDQ